MKKQRGQGLQLGGRNFSRFRFSLVILGCFGLVLVISVASASGNKANAAAPKVTGSTQQACAYVGSGRARCLAEVSSTVISSKTGPATSGFGPSEFHTAYQLPCKPNGPVASVCAAPGSFGPQMVAIVDAGDYSGSVSALESDLATYDSNYGLPTCNTANGCLSVINQSGATSPLPASISGWSTEIALDVETAHTICQTCKITLVEASSDYSNDLSTAESTAAGLNPVSISNSWGSTGDDTAYDSHYKYNGIAVVAATGDNGTLTGGQSWPADIPQVIAAAGTTLSVNADKTWSNESVWSGSGGGCAVNYTAPSWQTSRSDWAANGCSNGGRAFGDVAADANPNSGAAVYTGGSWYLVGGTSLATPLIASMFAVGADLPATTSAISIPYQYASSTTTHDVTSGNDCTSAGQPNCTAKAGFDVPTGLGSPKALALFQAHIPEDINQDGHVNLLDFSLLASKYGQSSSSLGRPDINLDGSVNLLDFSRLASKYGI